jgi:hypothetical protein
MKTSGMILNESNEDRLLDCNIVTHALNTIMIFIFFGIKII